MYIITSNNMIPSYFSLQQHFESNVKVMRIRKMITNKGQEIREMIRHQKALIWW